MRLEHLTAEHVGRRIRVRAAGQPVTGVLTDIRIATTRYPREGHSGNAAYDDHTWVTLWIDDILYEPLPGWEVDVDMLD